MLVSLFHHFLGPPVIESKRGCRDEHSVLERSLGYPPTDTLCQLKYRIEGAAKDYGTAPGFTLCDVAKPP